MAIKPVNYKQYGSRWAYNDYSVAGKEKTNIYVSGCGPTSAAMIIAALADASVTPATCAAWSVKNGYKAVGVGTKYAWKKRSELTANAKKHAYDQIYAVLKAGTVVTVQQVTKLSNGEIWVKIPSGWVCAVQGVQGSSP